MAITWHGQVDERIEDAAAAGMLEACEVLLGQAIDETPYVEHLLRNSGTTDVEASGGKVTGAVSFNTPYARRQHEDLTLDHPQPGTKAKFLERPANAYGPTMQTIIANHIAGVIAS